MKHHKLGSSDLVVPQCCLGTMTWGVQNSEEEAWAQMDYALAHGVNFFDTAELYPVPPNAQVVGRTETYIGNWIKARNCRDKVIIATKVAGPPYHFGADVDRSWIVANRSEPAQAEAPQPQLDEANIRSALAASLRRLQTNYVDLYQIHWPSRYTASFGKRQYRLEKASMPAVAIEEQVRVMGELIKEGKVRHWGLSNESTFGVCQFHAAAQRLGVPPPVSIQNDFSLVARHFEEELAEACAPHNLNIGLLAYGPLAGGTLSGKYLNGQRPPGRHTDYPFFQPRYYCDKTLWACREYADLAAAHQLAPATLALAWCASRWYMASVIIGATNLEQLKQNILAFEVELDESLLEQIDDIHMKIRNPNALD